MQRLFFPTLLLVLACGPKSPPPVAAAAPPAPESAPAPALVAPAPAPASSNASLEVTLSYADGKTRSGHVVRIERGQDWFAEDGWTDDPHKLVLTLERGESARDVPWSEIASLRITPENVSSADCQYDSDYTPFMYMCVLRTTSQARTTGGETWDVSTRHRWRFTFSDGETVEFYAHKLPVREQDEPRPGMASENPEMYGRLQERLAAEVPHMLTRIEIHAD